MFARVDNGLVFISLNSGVVLYILPGQICIFPHDTLFQRKVNNCISLKKMEFGLFFHLNNKYPFHKISIHEFAEHYIMERNCCCFSSFYYIIMIDQYANFL